MSNIQDLTKTKDLLSKLAELLTRIDQLEKQIEADKVFADYGKFIAKTADSVPIEDWADANFEFIDSVLGDNQLQQQENSNE